MNIQEIGFPIIIALWVFSIYMDRRFKKNWRDQVIEEMAKRLQRRVVLIEGRCPKCDELLPDEVIEDLNGKKLKEIKSEGIH